MTQGNRHPRNADPLPPCPRQLPLRPCGNKARTSCQSASFVNAVPMSNPFLAPILRLNPTADASAARPAHQRGTRLKPERVAALRRLVEDTNLPMRAIALQAVVSLSTV